MVSESLGCRGILFSLCPSEKDFAEQLVWDLNKSLLSLDL